MTERKRFKYYFAMDPSTTMPELRARHGQLVTVVGPVDPATYDHFEVGPMVVIEFDDGYRTDVFDDELIEPDAPLLDDDDRMQIYQALSVLMRRFAIDRDDLRRDPMMQRAVDAVAHVIDDTLKGTEQ